MRVHTCRLVHAPHGTGDNNANDFPSPSPPVEPTIASVSSTPYGTEEIGALHDGQEEPGASNEEPEVTVDETGVGNNSNDVAAETGIGNNSDGGAAAHVNPTLQNAPNANVKVKVGNRIQGFNRATGENVSGKIVSRAGKVSGKNKNCFNVQHDCDGTVS